MIARDACGNDHELVDPDQEFEIQLPWLSPWGNSRMHWRQASARKRQQKHLTRLQLEANGVVPLLPVTIVLERVTHRGTLDDDNVPDALKYVRDEIARWMGLASDRQDGLRFLYGQLKTPRQGYLGVRVTIKK